MPETLIIAIFVLGAVMLLLALVSGGFKIFGSEMPGIASRPARILAFAIGAILIGFALYHFKEEPAAKPSADTGTINPPASSSTPAPVAAAHLLGGDASPSKVTPAPETLNDPSTVRMFGREGEDYGVPPRNAIADQVGAPTPMTIPGAKTISTGELYAAMRSNRRLLLVDVLDSPHQGLPGARRYPGVGLPSPSTDLLTLLDKDTGGDKSYPVVFYCQGSQCWESYNAALRARDGGYSNVYWYRGGIEAWGMAGLPGG